MTSKQAKEIIVEIEKLNPKLNDTEKGFIYSIKNSIWVSQKQSMFLMSIYGKAAGKGLWVKN